MTFTLEIEPLSMQSETRFARIGNRVRTFSTKRKTSYLDAIAMMAKQHRPPMPFTGPVILGLTFILRRPQTLMGKKHPDGWIPCGRRPDRTNLLKAIEDGLSGAGFWIDDGQVFDGPVRKFYAERGGAPRIIVSIEELRESLPPLSHE